MDKGVEVLGGGTAGGKRIMVRGKYVATVWKLDDGKWLAMGRQFRTRKAAVAYALDRKG
jgi:hypothetical protein